jgi:hypothetical protein
VGSVGMRDQQIAQATLARRIIETKIKVSKHNPPFLEKSQNLL